MRVKVHYMAQLRRAAGIAEESLEVKEGVTVAGLLEQIAATRESARPVLLGPDTKPHKSLLLFVNDEQATGERTLREGDVITLLTPMAGGANSNSFA